MNLLKLAVVLTVLYLFIEVGSAFLPGHAVDRVLHDPHHCAAIADPAGAATCMANSHEEAR